MRGRLVGHDVEAFARARPGRLDLGRVADQGDGYRLPGRGGGMSPAQRHAWIGGEPVDIPDLEPSSRALRVHLDREAYALVHRDRQGLRATHPTETGRQDDAAAKRAAEVLARELAERLEGALQDALGADVDPRPGGHLPVHHQALPLELAEVLPGRPAPDE